MDPCPFVRLLVGSLALRSSSNNNSLIPSNCYCKIKLKNMPTHIADCSPSQLTHQLQASFNFNKPDFQNMVEKSSALKIEVYSGRKGNPICGLGSGKLLGVVSVNLDSKSLQLDSNSNWVLHNGWVGFTKKHGGVELHLNVWVEPDPRFAFEFEGEPECSPQVFQVNGKVRQAVFTCKFRNKVEKQVKKVKERKGWSVTIHDLSGSPVAMASMVTPFVPSQGSDLVRRSNPGGWLILRPGENTWKPWGRLEAWREGREMGYRLEVLGMTLSSSVISRKLRKFVIDIGNGVGSPMTTPTGSFDSSSGSGSVSGSDIWELSQGFVMSSTVGMSGRKPEVEIGVQHVTCTEDAAAFVALAAALHLSLHASQPFSKNLRNHLSHHRD